MHESGADYGVPASSSSDSLPEPDVAYSSPSGLATTALLPLGPLLALPLPFELFLRFFLADETARGSAADGAGAEPPNICTMLSEPAAAPPRPGPPPRPFGRAGCRPVESAATFESIMFSGPLSRDELCGRKLSVTPNHFAYAMDVDLGRGKPGLGELQGVGNVLESRSLGASSAIFMLDTADYRRIGSAFIMASNETRVI